MKKRSARPPEGKRARFVRITEIRVNKALSALNGIGNLANGALYEYDEADIKYIMDSLGDALAKCSEKFNKQPKQTRVRFSFPIPVEEGNPNKLKEVVAAAGVVVDVVVPAVDDSDKVSELEAQAIDALAF